MEQVVLDQASCSTYNAELDQELGNYTKVVNEIGNQSSSISAAWQGQLSANFLSQFEAFLPNLTIGYNIIHKSSHDLTAHEPEIVEGDLTLMKKSQKKSLKEKVKDFIGSFWD